MKITIFIFLLRSAWVFRLLESRRGYLWLETKKYHFPLSGPGLSFSAPLATWTKAGQKEFMGEKGN